ncbi:MAG TPA: sulfite exporter TauE/SafE family protein [candidate division Zixibacteria bacterium]|nr:sulfite exporter TauE/SafE family protein [candidate division Zixibacteria bacterium]
MFEFPISGVETYWWLPPLVAFVVSALSSIAGLSGAFLLLPFQVSFLGYVGPGVSPTNLLYNIVAIPSGVYRYLRERRMVWSLAWATAVGTLPGVIIGGLIRIYWLPDPAHFKPFAGAVLLYIGLRLVKTIVKPSAKGSHAGTFRVTNQIFTLRTTEYDFEGDHYRTSTPAIMALSFIVGIVGGTYGIGGGAIIAPFFVSIFGLPVYTIAGAALFGTFLTSVVGVLFYWLYGLVISETANVGPDWLLGFMLGIGGAVGTYVGARMQRYLPERLIKIVLTGLLLFAAVRYLLPLITN